MKTKNLIIVALGCLIATSNAFAEHEKVQGHTGYVNANHDGLLLRDSEESCVRTTYFNKPQDGLVACGDAAPVESLVTVITQQEVTETVSLSDKDNVLFEFDKAHLTSQGEEALANFMTKLGDVDKITIAGYTDAIGSPSYNKQLSQDRANAVKDFFVGHGFSNDKITTEGFGEENATVTADCLSQYGKVPTFEINKLDHQLKAKKFKSRYLSKTLRKQRAKLANKLDQLRQRKSTLLACTAPDRKVVFMVEHSKQVTKLVNVTKVVDGNENTNDATTGTSSNMDYTATPSVQDNSLQSNNTSLDDTTSNDDTSNDKDDSSSSISPVVREKALNTAGADTTHNPAPTDVLANPVPNKDEDSLNNSTTNVNVVDDNE